MSSAKVHAQTDLSLESYDPQPQPQHREITEDGCMDADVASQLTAALQQDSVQQLMQLMESFSLTQETLGHLLPERPPKSRDSATDDEESSEKKEKKREKKRKKEEKKEKKRKKELPRWRRGFRRVAHVCVHFHSADVLRHFASDEQLQHLLLIEDSDGSNILHSLAKVRLLREDQEDEKSISEFEEFVMSLLSSLQDKSGFDEQQRSALQAMCFQENHETLRPLEFAMDIGAYETFLRISKVPGFLLQRRQRLGAQVHSTYDLREYDPFLGSRSHRSPLLLLSMMDSGRVEALNRSRLMQSALISSWWNDNCRQMSLWLTSRRIALCMFVLLISPIGFQFQSAMVMLQRPYELKKGYSEYVKLVRDALENILRNESHYLLDGANFTDIFTFTTAACQPKNIINFVKNGTRGKEIIKSSPIIGIFSVTRQSAIDGLNSAIPNTLYVIISFLPYIIGSGRWLLLQRLQPWHDSKRSYFTFAKFYFICHCATTIFGLFHIACSLGISPLLDCTLEAFGQDSLNSVLLPIMTHLTETSAVLYMFCAMLQLNEILETSGRHIAFLSICFRKMCTKFVFALPLLFMWAYLVFGSLMYVTDFENKEFANNYDVLYSPLRVLLNIANINRPRMSTVILHTLFVLIVTINIQNFLIAYISNEYNEIAANFDLVYQLTRLSHFINATMSCKWFICCTTKKKLMKADRKRFEIVELNCSCDDGPDFDWGEAPLSAEAGHQPH